MESKRQPQALFHVEASAAIGQGHVRRCLTLARSLDELGWECFFHPPTTAADVGIIVGKEFRVVDALPDRRVDLIVVDSYETDAGYETSLRDRTDLILALDDRPIRPHDCDLLLDASPGRSRTAYEGLLPDGCEVLAGPDFALVSRSFAERRAASLSRREAGGAPKRVFVSFGASDGLSMTSRAISAIAPHAPGIRFDAVVGSSAPGITELRAAAEGLGNVTVHVDHDNLADLMAEADLALGAAGGTSLERCCLGVPSIVYVTAGNQQDVARGLEDAGAAILVSGEEPERALSEAFSDLIDDLPRLKAMSESAAALCDGLGSERVAARIQSLCDEGISTR